MSDETGNGVFVLHSVSGCYAEVHISWEIINLHLSKSEGLPSCVAPENYHLKNGELTRFVV